MTSGMTPLTIVHVALSLIGILSGFAVVFVAQLFMKVPALKAMAPAQSEPPFKLTQLVVLIFFIVLSIVAAKKFRGEPIRPA